MKLLMEFHQAEKDGEYSLEMMAYGLDSLREFEAARKELEAVPGLRYRSIHSDTIQAEVIGNYEDVLRHMRTLETQGWAWNEPDKEETDNAEKTI